jgi:hypothetical protein
MGSARASRATKDALVVGVAFMFGAGARRTAAEGAALP